MGGDALDYVHGYSRAEQERLVAQAAFHRDTLILPELRCQPGERLLEIGCGAGAVLGVLATGCPGLAIAGIDRAAEQIAFARALLQGLGVAGADLRQGDATSLPWPAETFDHVYIMWLLEHVQDPRPVLAEARRVLRPGGSITVNETDYDMTHAYPRNPDFDYLAEGQRALFRRSGTYDIGRRVGTELHAAGFRAVRAGFMGYHRFVDGGPGLRELVDYMLGFLDPMVSRMAAELGLDEARLRRGADHMRGLPDLPAASFTQVVFRASAMR